MCTNHTCHASSSQWQTSDWAFPPVNRRNCCCAAPPPPFIPGSINPSSRQVLVQPPQVWAAGSRGVWANPVCAGRRGKGWERRVQRGDLQGTIRNTSDGACGCTVRQTERGGGESLVTELYAWIYNAHTHFLSLALCFHVVSTPAHVLPLYCLCIFNHTWMYIL